MIRGSLRFPPLHVHISRERYLHKAIFLDPVVRPFELLMTLGKTELEFYSNPLVHVFNAKSFMCCPM